MSIRPVKTTNQAPPTMEGAGVHLHRVFGFDDTNPFDPFLMMDDFRNDNPAEYFTEERLLSDLIVNNVFC